MRRTLVRLVLFAGMLGTTACADSTAPASNAMQVPASPSATRYILASGDIPPAGCRDLGNGYWLCDDSGDPAATKPALPTAPSTSPTTSAR
jgi:hypothetical protein